MYFMCKQNNMKSYVFFKIIFKLVKFDPTCGSMVQLNESTLPWYVISLNLFQNLVTSQYKTTDPKLTEVVINTKKSVEEQINLWMEHNPRESPRVTNPALCYQSYPAQSSISYGRVPVKSHSTLSTLLTRDCTNFMDTTQVVIQSDFKRKL